MEEIAELVGVTPAEVRGTATFYDMLHTEPVGTYLVSVCTNIACLLGGAAELLEHAEERLGVRAGGTTADGRFTLEEAECLADCDRAPACRSTTASSARSARRAFDQLVDDLRGRAAGRRRPAPRRRWCRVRRGPGPDREPTGRRCAAERAAADAAQAQRAAPAARSGPAGGQAGQGADGHHRRAPHRHRPARTTTTRTPSSASWPPAATRACARP